MSFVEIKATKKSLGKRKKLFDVAINDADYIVQPVINGKRSQCPFYKCWSGMVRRCYSDIFHQKRPTYKDCSVCDEWLTFSNFKAWMVNQDWQGNDLDKDLIKLGNKIYSPEFCIFIDPLVNGFLHENRVTRGRYMIGVSKHSCGKYQASINYLGKRIHLGLFDSEIKANKKYLDKKLEATDELILMQSNKAVIKALNIYKENLTKTSKE